MTDLPTIDWSGVSLPGITADSRVVVGGGGGAMGRALAHALLAQGASVTVVGRRGAALNETRDSSPAPDRCRTLVLDIADAAAVDDAIDALVGDWGSITGVANCAAVGDGSARIDDIDPDTAAHVASIDLWGPIWLSRACARSMREDGGGAIVQVASVAMHRVATTGGAVYGSVKAGMLRAVQSMAVEWGPDNIRANQISPGQTPTPLKGPYDVDVASPKRPGASADMIPLRRRGRLDDYVGAILFLLSDLSAYVTGQDIPVEGGVMWPRAMASPS